MSFLNLTDDNFYEIFLYFSFTDIDLFLTLNKYISSLLMSEFFWEGMCKRDFPATKPQEQQSYKSLYKLSLMQSRKSTMKIIEICEQECREQQNIQYITCDIDRRAKELLKCLLKVIPAVESSKSKCECDFYIKKIALRVFNCIKLARDLNIDFFNKQGKNISPYNIENFNMTMEIIQSMDDIEADEWQLVKEKYIYLLKFAYLNDGIANKKERQAVGAILQQSGCSLPSVSMDSERNKSCLDRYGRFFVELPRKIAQCAKSIVSNCSCLSKNT